MPPVERTLKIFVSSPADVAEERALAARVFSRLEQEFRDTVNLTIVMWEHEPLLASSSFQGQIESPALSDLFVTILWSRLGTPLPRQAGDTNQRSPTGTEFEIREALNGYRETGHPDILVYRKTAHPRQNLDSPDAEERLRQFQRLKSFWSATFTDGAGALRGAFHTFNESYEFGRRLYEHVRRWLERKVGSGTTTNPRWRGGSPFRGLKVFESEHRDIFFGRARALSDVIRRISTAEQIGSASQDRPHLLLIEGMSGNGKSSLVRAGLLPLLDLRAIEGVGRWYSVIIKPSESHADGDNVGFFGELAEKLRGCLPALKDSPDLVRALGARLQEAPEQAAARLEGYVASSARTDGLDSRHVRVAVFVDQLEELFTGHLADEQIERVARGIAAVAMHPSFWVIATMRSDMVHRLEDSAALSPLLRSVSRYTLAAPSSDELGQMIREPAEAAGLVWDVRDHVRLDEELAREADRSPEGLPLLEFTLERLYESREDHKLTFAAYDALGGLKGALITIADRVVREAGSGGSHTLSHLMRALVSVDDRGTATRRYAPREEVQSTSAEVAMLERLLKERLCVADVRGGIPVVVLAHEALITSWPQVMDWLKREQGLLQSRDRLVRDAHLWDERGRRRTPLSPAPEKVAEIQRLRAEGLPLLGIAGEFASASLRESNRRRWFNRGVVGFIAALAVVALVAFFVGVSQRERAELTLFLQYEDHAWQALARGDARLAARYALAGHLATRDYASSIERRMQPRWRLLLAPVVNRFEDARPAPGLVRDLNPIDRPWPVVSEDRKNELDAFIKSWSAVYASDKPPQTIVPEKLIDVAPDGSLVLTVSILYVVKDQRYIHVENEYSVDDTEPTLHVWDPHTGHEVARWTTHGRLQASFASDAKRVVIINWAKERFLERLKPQNPEDGPVYLMDIPTRTIRAYPLKSLPEGSQISVSADGARLLLCCQTGRSPLVIEIDGGRATPVGSAGAEVKEAVFSPDGQRVAVAEADGVITLWDVILGSKILRIESHTQDAQRLLFSPDGKVLLSYGGGSSPEFMQLWNMDSGTQIAALRSLEEETSPPAFSRESDWVLVWDRWKAFRWSVSRVAEQSAQTLNCPADEHATPVDDQRMLVWGSSSVVRLCGLQAAAQTKEFGAVQHGVINAAALSLDATQLVTGSSDRTAVLWQVATGKPSEPLRHASPVRGVTFSPDGLRVATGAEDGSVSIWDSQTGMKVFKLAGHRKAVLSVSYSRDGSRILTTSDDGTAAFWDPAKTDPIDGYKQHNAAVRAGAFSLDSRRAATGANDGWVRLWNPITGAELLRLGANGSPIDSVNFSPHGDLLAAASEDGMVRIWETDEGREIESFHVESLVSASFMPDGQRLMTVSSDHRVRFWELGRLAASFDELARYACAEVVNGREDSFTDAELVADRSIAETFLRAHLPTRSVCEGYASPRAPKAKL